jgi:hypothetical protein
LYFYPNLLKIKYMKTKNMILGGGLLVLGYLIYKNSKNVIETTTEDTSGGGGGYGGGGMMGGMMGGMYPILPPLAPPTSINVIVPPIPRPFVNPKPFGTRAEPLYLSNAQEAPDSPATTGGASAGSSPDSTYEAPPSGGTRG